MNETNRSKFKKQLLSLAVASAVSCLPGFAVAANLGKLTVFSGLGQPLRAEVEVGAAKEELTGMLAALAAPETFRQAGVDYAPALRDLQFSVESRGTGAVIKLSSQKPINEPFLDFLIELNWSSGRVIREYTFLLDPPEVTMRQPIRQIAEAKVVDTGNATAGGSQVAPAPEPKSERRTASSRSEAVASRGAPGTTHLVRQGDTLRKIAQDHRVEGVTLEQMLIALYQNNRDAFIANNMNRLKAGVILSVPEPAEAAALPDGEAKRIYLAHASNWNAYRQKLAAASAGTVARDDGQASQASAGRVTAKVAEKMVLADQAKDQVKVARTDLAGAKTSGADELDRIAKEKALAEAQDRLGLLEKNVGELQKLLEMKNRQLAGLQQSQVTNATGPSATEVKAPEAAKPVEVPKTDTVPAAGKAPVPAPVRPDAAPAVEPAKPVEAPKQAAASLPPEPELIDTLLEDPLLLGGAAGVAALLGAYVLARRRRGLENAEVLKSAPTTAQNVGADVTGGNDADHTPPHTGDFSQAGPGLIDSDDVDAVAEADVYIAYGRDQQAEEILLDALQKDPQRLAIPVKLLEIYANRHSLQQFETLASELYAQVAGKGPEWQKVALLGYGLDPANPLYALAFDSGSDDSGAAALPEGMAPQIGTSPEASPGEPLAVSEEEREPGSDAVAQVGLDDAMTLDFDLGDSSTAESQAPAPEAADESGASEDLSDALDFELPTGESSLAETNAGDTSESPPRVEESSMAVNSLEFNLDLPEGDEATLVVPEYAISEIDPGASGEATPELGHAAAVQESVVDVPATDALSVAEFEIELPAAMDEGTPSENLDEAAAAVNFDISLSASEAAAEPMPAFDLGTINLDLATPAPVEETLVEAAAAPVRDAQWEEVNTKLDLAKAYEEMGDIEGARELLLEVVQEGTPDLAASAQAMLDRIGV